MISNNMLHTSPSQERAETKRTQKFQVQESHFRSGHTFWWQCERGRVLSRNNIKLKKTIKPIVKSYTHFRFVWWYEYRRGRVNIGEMWGSNKEIQWICEWEVESEKTSFTVEENGCQQVSSAVRRLSKALNLSKTSTVLFTLSCLVIVFHNIWKRSFPSVQLILILCRKRMMRKN